MGTASRGNNVYNNLEGDEVVEEELLLITVQMETILETSMIENVALLEHHDEQEQQQVLLHHEIDRELHMEEMVLVEILNTTSHIVLLFTTLSRQCLRV